ncbi:hypothetical protein TELCIR_07185 [Teladorsagia circumcincta]|uniref:RNA-directed DNA polymerase n=1 Tax=Teladorsagia circumcincta TaxID=45464 RepID=A0A2G9UL01_TELCI|nr:hypothetical protein TELCIR_07185 [Teladorsagia circumcincta]
MDDAMKTRLLVAALDAATHTRFTRHILPKEPGELNWTDTLATLKTLFGTKKSLFRRRFECFRMNFSPNEDIDNFVNLLKARALEANFKDIRQETLECLALVFAFQAPELADYRVRFLRKLDEDEKITVDDLVKEYHAWRSVKDDSRIVEAANAPEIRTVQKRKRHRLPPQTKPRLPPSPCPICQQQHWKKDCPQNRNATSAAQESRTAPRRRTKQLSPRTWYQRAIGRSGDVQKYLEVHINGHPTRLQLDTGADVTIISRPTWMQLGSPRLQKTSDVFKGANGQPLPIHGSFDADFVVVDNQGKAHPGQGVCYVSDDNDLLGITWIEQISDFNSVLRRFNVQKVQTLNYDAVRDQTIAKLKHHFTDVFKPELGCCTKAKATLYLKPDAHPVFIKKRPVPYASVPLLDAEIDRLVAQDVISAVDHSQWAAPIVVVRKANGSIRLCADFSTGLNDALQLHRHPLPTAEDVFTKLNGGTMPKPKDTAQVRSFLGLINYYGAFVPEMRQLRAPLDALLKKESPFNWNSECDSAFERAKEVLASDLLLTHYNPNLPIVIAADASDYGIGAVISHRYPDGTEKAVYHASRSLSAAEKNYGQVEKEGLALVYAVRKFHRYIYGRHFTLLTDHKPLLAIFGSKRGIPAYSANRLQRWRLTLLAYDFDIEYRSTTSFGQADALSRLISAQSPPEEDVIIAKIARDVNAIFHDNVSRLPVTAKDVARATAEDDCLRQVLDHVVHNNWSKKPSPTVASYAHLRNDLSTQQGCLVFGMNRMKALARSYVFWTKINDDLEKLVRNCAACQESAKSPVKNTLRSWIFAEATELSMSGRRRSTLNPMGKLNASSTPSNAQSQR